MKIQIYWPRSGYIRYSPRKHLEVIFDIPSNRFTVSLWQFPSKIQDRVYLYIPNEIGSVRKIDLFLFRDFVVVIRECVQGGRTFIFDAIDNFESIYHDVKEKWSKEMTRRRNVLPVEAKNMLYVTNYGFVRARYVIENSSTL